jgi:transcription initiation factor IIE alpha subunit
MQNRSYSNSTSFSARASARRRIRRTTSAHGLYCRTNGCTTYLQPDASGLSAQCPICGASRTIA